METSAPHYPGPPVRAPRRDYKLSRPFLKDQTKPFARIEERRRGGKEERRGEEEERKKRGGGEEEERRRGGGEE